MRTNRDNLSIYYNYYGKIIEDDAVFPLKFISHDGYYPLIIIPSFYRGINNPYFRQSYKQHASSRISYRLPFDATGYYIKYRKNRAYSSMPVNLYSGFLSVIGTHEEFDYMPSSLAVDAKYRMKADLDIFCLGVTKLPYLPEVKIEKSHNSYMRRRDRKSIHIDLDLTKMKIFISEEKLRKPSFLNQFYTATVRKEILYRINNFRRDKNVIIEDVSDDYLERFVTRPKTVRTNSFAEAIKIDKEIKDSVFSNLKMELV